MKLLQVQEIAREIIQALDPAHTCRCIMVAGSVRREKPEVKDVEICYVPRYTLRVVDLFGATVKVSATDDAIDGLVARGVLGWDAEVKRNGPKHKRLVHIASGVVIELFAATPENWGLILALRTGPAEFNHKLVTQRRNGGAMPTGMRMQGGYLWRGLEQLESLDEETFFEQVGIPCWLPQERTVQRLRAWLEVQG